MFLYPFVNLIKWLFGSFSSDLVLCVFDNISCNIITVINIMLIVLIVDDLYNILLRYIIINRKMIVPSRQESGDACFHLSLVFMEILRIYVYVNGCGKRCKEWWFAWFESKSANLAKIRNRLSESDRILVKNGRIYIL